MNGVYGPQTDEIDKLLTKTRALTKDQAIAFPLISYYPWLTAWEAAWKTPRGVEIQYSREAAWHGVRCAAGDAVSTVHWYIAGHAAANAAVALVVRDLIDPDGFTLAHYNLLTGPWRQVVGKVHPNDKEIES